MRVIVADHPLIAHKLTLLRDERTPSPTFRDLVEELVTLLAYEATRGMRTETVRLRTPVGPAVGRRLAPPLPLVVPILRAEVGFLGLQRDEATLKAVTYAHRLPETLTGRECFVLDPMLATGGTLIAAIEYLLERGALDVTVICLLASPEGLQVLQGAIGSRASVAIVTAAVDERLDEKGYIVPGLGDAGDRLYGVAGD
jgi:uracil phosphoribosyltransferase